MMLGVGRLSEGAPTTSMLATTAVSAGAERRSDCGWALVGWVMHAVAWVCCIQGQLALPPPPLFFRMAPKHKRRNVAPYFFSIYFI